MFKPNLTQINIDEPNYAKPNQTQNDSFLDPLKLTHMEHDNGILKKN